MPPVLRSATKSQSAKAAGVTATTDSRPVKSRGGRSQNTKRDDEQDPASSHENQDESSHLSSNPTPDDQKETSQSNEGARTHDPDAETSQQVSEAAEAASPPKILSAEERTKLKEAAQAKYVKRWGAVYGQNFDTDEATEWEESFMIDVLDKLGRDGGNKKKGDKDGNQEERKKRREAVVKKYLKKWDGMLGMCYDDAECDELYKEFEEWMKGMEGVLDELMS